MRELTTAEHPALDLARALTRRWWVLALRGVLAIAFGLLMFFQPALTLASLVIFFGVFALVDGALYIWTALANRAPDNRWMLLLTGLLSAGVGLLTLFRPGVTTFALLVYIAIWAVAMGVLQIVAAVRLRHVIEGEFFLGLGGLVSVLFGVAVLARPDVGALAIVWMLATYVVVFGIFMLALGFVLKRHSARLSAI